MDEQYAAALDRAHARALTYLASLPERPVAPVGAARLDLARALPIGATPPDVVSQLMLAVPLLFLFEGSLIVMRLTERSEAKRKAAEAAAEKALDEPA